MNECGKINKTQTLEWHRPIQRVSTAKTSCANPAIVRRGKCALVSVLPCDLAVGRYMWPRPSEKFTLINIRVFGVFFLFSSNLKRFKCASVPCFIVYRLIWAHSNNLMGKFVRRDERNRTTNDNSNVTTLDAHRIPSEDSRLSSTYFGFSQIFMSSYFFSRFSTSLSLSLVWSRWYDDKLFVMNVQNLKVVLIVHQRSFRNRNRNQHVT